MTFLSRYKDRDLELPKHREKLLEIAIKDLTNDQDVLAIYLGGSMAKENCDNYSDIDLHIIVTPGKYSEFVLEKRNRPKKWGDVLYYEDVSLMRPVVVVHFDCFVKMDTFYHEPNSLESSLWMKGLKALYDPHGLVEKVLKESSLMEYKPTSEDVELWRGKIFAYIHEAYRSVMRNETYDAIYNLDKIRWMMAKGWYMEMDRRVDSSWGDWSKLEGERSDLQAWQLSLLYNWNSSLSHDDIMKSMLSMVPEFLKLHKSLCEKTGLEENLEWCKRILEKVL